MKKLYPYIRPQIRPFVMSIVCKGAGTVTDLMIPLLMGIVIDQGILTGNTVQIVHLCALMFVTALVTVGLNLLGHYLSSCSTQKIGENIRNALYKHIQGMTIADVDDISTASLITRTTNDVEHVSNALLKMTRFMVRAPITAIGGTVLALLIDPYITLILLVAMVLLATASISVYKVTRPIFLKVQKCVDKMTRILRENLEGIRVIKAFDKQDYELERFDEQSRGIRSFEMKAGRYNALMSPGIALISSITTAVVLYVSGWRIDSGTLQIGSVVAILNYVNMILNAMRTIPRMFMLLSRANTSAERITSVFERKSTTSFGPETTPADTDVILEFRNVTFVYPHASVPALLNLSFKIRRGETLAVIGGTGSGKTTLLNLILRLYEPTSGEILLEGRDIRSYTKDTLTKRITAAMQQYNIFALSVKENVTLDMPEDEERLRSATTSAQIIDMINELDGKFDYKISQNGSNLSGGQKQRISVARTLYRKSDLVILDDVSSALDYRTDLRLRAALKKNYANTTVVLISQRIASVKDASNILVLKNGMLAGIGTHEQLVESCEEYQNICQTQAASATQDATVESAD